MVGGEKEEEIKKQKGERGEEQETSEKGE